MGPLEKKVNRKLEELKAQGSEIKFTIKPESDGIDQEAIAEEMLNFISWIERYQALPERDKMLIDLGDAYGNVKKAVKKIQMRPDEWMKISEPERERLHEIYEYVSKALMVLGNWRTKFEKVEKL